MCALGNSLSSSSDGTKHHFAMDVAERRGSVMTADSVNGYLPGSDPDYVSSTISWGVTGRIRIEMR